ncbi:nuclease EXOG, mitochondrial isoform X2 [Ambystoma mexicanum]|uniref:nuclease EXOG, mitochondrial isoform X2 n=1 Tax=Ambystoma mexicanum TaxID=8296 RepID=UPI0037E7A935
MRIISGVVGPEDTWRQQETTNFPCKQWLKPSTCQTLCHRIMRIMLDSGTGMPLSQWHRRQIVVLRFLISSPYPLKSLEYKPKGITTSYLSMSTPEATKLRSQTMMEMYCRDLTAKFDDVWVVSGPLVLPQTEEDGKRKVTYTVIGKDDVAVPSHLFKVILARKSTRDNEPLVLGAFVVPNSPISFSHQLPEFQVDIEELEKMSGLMFFPRLDKKKDFKNICEVHHCKLMDFAEFTLYISGRKVQSAKTTERLEKVLSELEESGVQPDEYLLNLYKKKMNEMLQEQKVPAERKSG